MMFLYQLYGALVLFTIINSSGVVAVVTHHYDSPPETILTSAEDGDRINGVQDRSNKDIILGGLFTVHIDAAGSAGGKCGETVWGYGMETLEAMFYALDRINSDPLLLPNISVGYDIRDTCQSENIALDESVDFVLSNGQVDVESCELISNGNHTKLIPVSAVIGPLESFVTIPTASFFRLFQMPQVSYASSSPLLNNRDRYGYFFRTIPPDDLQAQALIDLILHYGWDHVSTIYSNNIHTVPLNNHFHLLAKQSGICIDLNEPINEDFQSSQLSSLARRLQNSSANVVVLIAAADHTSDFLSEVQTVFDINDRARFVWLTIDSVLEEAAKFPDITSGMWGIAPFSEMDYSFEEYFSRLNPYTNKRDPWFKDYYQELFNCKIAHSNCTNASVTSVPNYRQFTLVPLVIDAVYSVAHAIDAFLKDNCQQPLQWFPHNQTCVGQNQTFTGETLLPYLRAVDFTSSTGNHISFDDEGNIEGRYNLLNYQATPSATDCEGCTKQYNLVPVCYWDQSRDDPLVFYPNTTSQFGVDHSSDTVIYELKSQCQKCPPGYMKRQVISSCCGVCDPCLGQNYTNETSSPQCSVCPSGKWGNKPLAGSNECIDIEESYLKISDPWAIVLILIAVIGLTCVFVVIGIFVWFWNTSIVKSSGREQMILILTGIVLCFLITAVYIIRPSITICTLQRIGLWFCFSLILSALLIKLVRIARIFMHRKIVARPKLIEPKYQVLFTFLLVGVQLVLVLISLVVVYPYENETIVNNEKDQNDFPLVVVKCATPHPAMIAMLMIYLSILIIASNVLAILTIRFPENFNESKHVAFSTFALGLIWIAFVFIYLNTSDKFQTAVISFTLQMSGLAVLFCLFVPRIFILFLVPKPQKGKENVNNSDATVQSHSVKAIKGLDSSPYTMTTEI